MEAEPRLLVMRAGAIGDLVLTLPALAALRERFPRHRLVLAARADMLPLLRGNVADDVFPFDSLLLAPLFSADSPLSNELAAKLDNLQVAVLWLPEQQARTVAERLRRLGAEQIVAADPMRAGQHAADHLIATLAPLGVPPQTGATPKLTLPERVHAGVHGRQLGAGRRVVLHVGSGGTAKRWPADRFLELAERIAHLPDMEVLLVRGPAEEAMATSAKPRSERIRTVDSPPMTTLANILMGCALYAGNDSGITHLAAALGRPTVALFGPTDPAIWGPRGEQVSIVRSPDGEMRGLSVERVWREVCKRLAVKP